MQFRKWKWNRCVCCVFTGWYLPFSFVDSNNNLFDYVVIEAVSGSCWYFWPACRMLAVKFYCVIFLDYWLALFCYFDFLFNPTSLFSIKLYKNRRIKERFKCFLPAFACCNLRLTDFYLYIVFTVTKSTIKFAGCLNT